MFLSVLRYMKNTRFCKHFVTPGSICYAHYLLDCPLCVDKEQLCFFEVVMQMKVSSVRPLVQLEYPSFFLLMKLRRSDLSQSHYSSVTILVHNECIVCSPHLCPLLWSSARHILLVVFLGYGVITFRIRFTDVQTAKQIMTHGQGSMNLII